MSRRSYGQLEHVVQESMGRAPRQAFWILMVEPQVAVRVKRMFPRVRQERTGRIVLADTPDTSLDLHSMLLARYPLKMDDTTRALLEQQAARALKREEAVVRILNGQGRLEYPATEGRPARDYQLAAADLCLTNGALLCTDELGTGKTQTALMLYREPEALPGLVVTLAGKLPGQWLKELREVHPHLRGHVVTSTTPYSIPEAKGMDGHDADVIIMNYHKLAGWADHLRGVVNSVVYDEAQELRNDTDRRRAAVTVSGGARWGMQVTNSPVMNYGGDIYNVLSVIAPDALGTREEFVREWCTMSPSGKSVVAQPAALGAYLREQGLMLGRTRADIGRELPDPEPIDVRVSSDARVMEQAVADSVDMARLLLSSTSDRAERFRAAGDLDWRMRHATGVAKAPFVAQFVRMLLDSTDEKILLMGWHRDVYAIWLKELSGYDVDLYTGSESLPQKERAYQRFVHGSSRVLIMSLASGAGLDGLQQAASTIVFGELDWSPKKHDQAIGRLSRDGMDVSRHVRAYFLWTDDGADPRIMQTLLEKRQQAEPINTGKEVNAVESGADPDKMRKLAADILKQAGQEVPAGPERAALPPVVRTRTGTGLTVVTGGQEATPERTPLRSAPTQPTLFDA